MSNINWHIKHFNDLTTRTFHDLVALREQVFIVEQNCVYQDVDGKDPESYHLIGLSDDGILIATARILPLNINENKIAIGRVVIHADYRKSGLGRVLMNKAIIEVRNIYGRVPIKVSAQKYLKNFYLSLGFIVVGEEYLEDGIPSIEMSLKE